MITITKLFATALPVGLADFVISIETSVRKTKTFARTMAFVRTPKEDTTANATALKGNTARTTLTIVRTRLARMEEVASIILLEEALLVTVKVASRVSDARTRLTSAMAIHV